MGPGGQPGRGAVTHTCTRHQAAYLEAGGKPEEYRGQGVGDLKHIVLFWLDEAIAAMRHCDKPMQAALAQFRLGRGESGQAAYNRLRMLVAHCDAELTTPALQGQNPPACAPEQTRNTRHSFGLCYLRCLLF